MRAYRAVLVWALRAAAALIVGWAAFDFFRAVAVYEHARTSLDPVELAGMGGPIDYLIPLVPITGGLALFCLVLAEILSLLNNRNRLGTH